MSRPRFMQRVLRFFAERRLLPEARMLEWYPPFLAMRIKVIQLDRDWREVRIRLPLNAISLNPGGVMFGGYQSALADPVPLTFAKRTTKSLMMAIRQ